MHILLLFFSFVFLFSSSWCTFFPFFCSLFSFFNLPMYICRLTCCLLFLFPFLTVPITCYLIHTHSATSTTPLIANIHLQHQFATSCTLRNNFPTSPLSSSCSEDKLHFLSFCLLSVSRSFPLSPSLLPSLPSPFFPLLPPLYPSFFAVQLPLATHTHTLTHYICVSESVLLCVCVFIHVCTFPSLSFFDLLLPTPARTIILAIFGKKTQHNYSFLYYAVCKMRLRNMQHATNGSVA